MPCDRAFKQIKERISDGLSQSESTTLATDTFPTGFRAFILNQLSCNGRYILYLQMRKIIIFSSIDRLCSNLGLRKFCQYFHGHKIKITFFLPSYQANN